uniref:Uncharacterized protein n=1 Tax=Aegilops tauschii TaxID=37682 RepID=N1R3X8_AEGTA
MVVSCAQPPRLGLPEAPPVRARCDAAHAQDGDASRPRGPHDAGAYGTPSTAPPTTTASPLIVPGDAGVDGDDAGAAGVAEEDTDGDAVRAAAVQRPPALRRARPADAPRHPGPKEPPPGEEEDCQCQCQDTFHHNPQGPPIVSYLGPVDRGGRNTLL